MEYCLVSRSVDNNQELEKVLTQVINGAPKQLFGYTKKELDALADYDVINILSLYYGKMDADYKEQLCDAVESKMKLAGIGDVVDNLSVFTDDDYIPLSCMLIDRLADARVTKIIYESLFGYCRQIVDTIWDEEESYSNYLVLLNVAYFEGLAYRLHVRDSYKACMKAFYKAERFDSFVESLYERNLENLEWDTDVELDVLEEIIETAKESPEYDTVIQEEYDDALARISDIKHEYAEVIPDETEGEGFEHIVHRTGIKEQRCVDIAGFTCHFCDAKSGNDEYIIVYQDNNRINEIIDDETAWKKFQHDLYYEDIREGKNTGVVYIVYILDEDSNNIPIQVIESDKTYGRKYVFTEDETITFINGIVKSSHDEIAAASPVQEWDRVLREEHLTGCLTEAYSSKKVENYLKGERFDADYVLDDDYSSLSKSAVPNIKWVKSLDTKGFRDFCFDDKIMEFGQINLFYGANGSGKTSVLEAIEYALTSEVRRVKDFKVKLPTDMSPKLMVYDREAGVHTFYPQFSKKNNKEIERVWYGVPVGRTKSNLNENFNRFNAFDSEAAYKFIHESDNSGESYASMFGNLMFGETVVDHEKKWQRFKKAFNDRYTELRTELRDARAMSEYYEESLSQKSAESKSDEIEQGIKDLVLKSLKTLPKSSNDRYEKVFEELSLVRKYVDALSAEPYITMTFSEIEEFLQDKKRKNLQYIKEKKEKSEEITLLTEKNGELKKSIFSEKEKLTEAQEKINSDNVDINNWRIVQNVLSHTDTIKLVNDLLDELTLIDRELFYISKIEQRTAVTNFLKLENYDSLPDLKKEELENELSRLKTENNSIEVKYEEAKKQFGEKEKTAIELRKLGKTLLVDSKCPLCGHEYKSTQELAGIIDSSVIVDDSIEEMLTSMQENSKKIIEIEKILDRENLIVKAKAELSELEDAVPMVNSCGRDYKKLFEYVSSKASKEKRKAEIVEQQETLDKQGFSLKNINACKEYKNVDSTYLEYKKVGTGTYDDFLAKRLNQHNLELSSIDGKIKSYEKQLTQNTQNIELYQNDIDKLDSLIEGLDVEQNRESEQALENIKTRFELKTSDRFRDWSNKYHTLFDKCELEINRLNAEESVKFEKEQLAIYKATIKRVEPMVERCANAVRAFESMQTLSSFVEVGIKSNIQQISKFFKWMHHSGEFEELGIDDEGIYAVRGLNHERIRTYQMSTGQRSTIAMAVMFTLHIAAPDAPQFLLLDEPLATMDDTQVLNVLDILKSLADQGTQIFFTTANGIMINLFKECFKNTDFDYKEYQFIKRVNRPSEIKESSINDVRTIEDLTLDDLTLDFNQFAQIREILRKNQEKLVAKDEWEQAGDDDKSGSKESILVQAEDEEENFYKLLSNEEKELLNILVLGQKKNSKELKTALASHPTYKLIYDSINEKAVDFFGETIVENDYELPWMEEDYITELQEQYKLLGPQ